MSTALPSSTPLPAFDFLHPPVVRDAILQTRRLNQQVRRYSNKSERDKPEVGEVRRVRGGGDLPYDPEGWSPSKLDMIFEGGNPPRDGRRRSAAESATENGKAESPMDEPPEDFYSSGYTADENSGTIGWEEEPPLNEPADQNDPNYCPHIRYVPTKRLVNYTQEEFRTLEGFDVAPHLKAVVQEVVDIIMRQPDRRQEVVLDLYRRFQLDQVLPVAYKFYLARYLYHSTRRRVLEAILDLGLGGRFTVPILRRLGRLEDAREIAMQNLRNAASYPIPFDVLNETLTVLDQYVCKGDWEGVMEFWETAVMCPVIQDPVDLISPYAQNSMLENCLVLQAPDIRDWYYRKASSVVMNPNATPKEYEFIKHVGAVLIKGFAKNRKGIEGLDLIKYITTTFKEIETISFFWEIHALRKIGRPHDALELYLGHRNREFELTMHHMAIEEEYIKHHLLNIQNEAMASASALNNFPVLRKIFEDLYKLGLEPSAYSYAIVMHAFARHGQADTVQRLFDMYSRTGKPMSIYLYAELLYVHVMLLDIPACERTFQLIQNSGVDLNRVVYDMYVSAYARTLNVDSALPTFRMYLKAVGDQPDLGIINHFVNLFANRNDPDAAVEMFNLIGQYGLTPQIHSFNCLLTAYVNVDDEVNAEAVIAKMRELGIRPDVVTWSTLLKIYVRRHDSQGIIDLFARMRRHGIQPNEITWGQLMIAIAVGGSSTADENVKRVMNRIKSLGIRPNVFHWNAYLTAVTKAKQDLGALQEAYDEMIATGVKPNMTTHQLLITAYCRLGGRAGQEIAEGIISRLTTIQHHVDLTSPFSPKTSLPPSLFEPIFRVQGPKLPLDQVQRVFDTFVNSAASVGGSPAEPDLDLLTQLLDIYRKHGDLEACKRTWKAIKHHADKASRSFRAMQSSEEEIRDFVVPGNRYLLDGALESYIVALSEANQLDEIDKVWDELVENGYDFTCRNWNTRIQVCLRHQKHIVWAFRACEEVLIDGWEKRFLARRKRMQNPPKRWRELQRQREDVKMLNRVFWPIEADISDLTPLPMSRMDQLEQGVEYFIYYKTMIAFLVLRKKLLSGASIVDSSGRVRPGPEVWDRLKTAFPRLVRAMFIQLKKVSVRKREHLTRGLEQTTIQTVRYAQAG